jgi:hypothetical protein
LNLKEKILLEKEKLEAEAARVLLEKEKKEAEKLQLEKEREVDDEAKEIE